MNPLSIECPDCYRSECIPGACGCPGCEDLGPGYLEAWIDFEPLFKEVALHGGLQWAFGVPASGKREDFSMELLHGRVDVSRVGDQFVAAAWVEFTPRDRTTDDAGNGTWEDIAVSSDPSDIVAAATAWI